MHNPVSCVPCYTVNNSSWQMCTQLYNTFVVTTRNFLWKSYDLRSSHSCSHTPEKFHLTSESHSMGAQRICHIAFSVIKPVCKVSFWMTQMSVSICAFPRNFCMTPLWEWVTASSQMLHQQPRRQGLETDFSVFALNAQTVLYIC